MRSKHEHIGSPPGTWANVFGGYRALKGALLHRAVDPQSTTYVAALSGLSKN